MHAAILLLLLIQTTGGSSMAQQLYSASARATAKIEGEQHLEALRKEGVLNLALQRPVKIRARRWDGKEEGLVVHLIRHGQGFHNLLGDIYRDFGVEVDSTGQGESPYTRPEIVDPPLTAIGRAQAKALRPTTEKLRCDLIVASPLARAVETARLAFPSSKVLAHPDAMEASGKNTCDKRRPLSDIADAFPFLDLSLMTSEDDDRWSPDTRESARSVSDRSYAFLLWLRQRSETHIAVATHSAWLFTLLNTAVLCDPPDLADWFLTGELRSLLLSFEDENV